MCVPARPRRERLAFETRFSAPKSNRLRCESPSASPANRNERREGEDENNSRRTGKSISICIHLLALLVLHRQRHRNDFEMLFVFANAVIKAIYSRLSAAQSLYCCLNNDLPLVRSVRFHCFAAIGSECIYCCAIYRKMLECLFVSGVFFG